MKSLFVSVITFLVGIFFIQFFQTSESLKTEGLIVQSIEKREVQNLATENPCEEILHRGKGKARNKNAVNGGVLNSRACMVMPEFPQTDIKFPNKIVVEVFVDVFGKIKSAKVTKGNSKLDKYFVDAALKTKVVPIWLGGEPVNVKGMLIYEF
jgi:hypothetical protein